MVTYQISIPERSSVGFDRRIKELEVYYEKKQDEEFGDKAFIWDYSGGERTMHKKREITDGFVILQAVHFFYDEIQRLEEKEKAEENVDETPDNPSSDSHNKSRSRWWKKQHTKHLRDERQSWVPRIPSNDVFCLRARQTPRQAVFYQ
jgi:hypothetical protein